MESEWRNLFSELCFKVFYESENGQELLNMLENRYFRSPVAIPGQDISWTFINEGRNELIRSFIHGIQTHMLQEQQKIKEGEAPTKRRRAPIRPIH